MLKQKQSLLQSELSNLSHYLHSKGLKLNKNVLQDDTDSDSGRDHEDHQSTIKTDLVKKGSL